MGMGFAPTWLRQVSPPPLLHKNTLTTGVCVYCAALQAYIMTRLPWHVAINPDQIGLVAADNRTRANHRYKIRAIGASSTGLHYSFAVRTVSDWNQLPAVVVEQENPAAFKAQLARCAPVRMP